MKIVNKKCTNILQIEFFNNFLLALNALKNQDTIRIGLSGGSSVNLFYDKLKESFLEINPEIRNKIRFCFLDERVLDFDDKDSNYKQVYDILFGDLIKKGFIGKKQIILPNFSLKNYEKEYFSRVQKIDIGLFGVGPDGHTCSLFPDHKLLDDELFGYLKITDSPKPPSTRITISKKMLQATKYAFIFFMGESKREALENFKNVLISYKSCPVKLVLDCENVYEFSDLYKKDNLGENYIKS